MSTEDSLAAPSGPASNGAAPHSWLRLTAGLAAVTVAAVVCALCIEQYLHARPLNLRKTSLALADTVEQLLLANRVAADHIQRHAPQLKRDEQGAASWYFIRFDVAVTDDLSTKGLAKVIGRNMLQHRVNVADTAPTPAECLLSLSLGNREFASVRLKGSSSRGPQTDLTPACGRIAEQVLALLEGQGIGASEIERHAAQPRESEAALWALTQIEVRRPAAYATGALASLVEAALAQYQVRVAPQARPNNVTALTVHYAGVPCVELVLREPAGPQSDGGQMDHEGPGSAGADAADAAQVDGTASSTEPAGKDSQSTPVPRLAIIVDDGGYDRAATEDILTLDPNLTLAILPSAPLTAETVQRARERGFELILHMPMDKTGIAGQITTDMTPEQIHTRTEYALAQVPGAVGANNHMGSAFTEDPEGMAAFLEVLKDKALYFIDSRTTPHTKALDTAKRMGLRAASRDMFLDNKKDIEYIRGQFQALLALAKEKNCAIGICHFRPHSAEVLAEVLPTLEREGIALVHASELVQ